MVLLADGLPVTPDATAASGYKITARQLAAAITPKTRLLLLNSPCNPSGAAYTRAELRALGDVLLDHPRVLIGTDDMYEHIYWGDEPFCSLAQAVPELYARTVTINGVSKAYAMTGWRIGYCGGPAEVITAMATIQGQSTSNPSSIAQKAAVAALNGDQSCVARMNESFRRRHDLVVAGLNAIPGLSCRPGAGTFYAFADVSGAIAALGLRDDHAFCEHLLEREGVAAVAGTSFGAPGHMRISFATSTDLLERALERIDRFVRQPTGAYRAV
jgi:aspartate aminotransferase